MSTELYETLALGMRYWFLFLMLLIVWRSYRWFVRDRRQRKKRLRLLPDAGLVGEWVVLSCDSGEVRPGDELPVPVEGVLGSIRSCDVCVPAAGVGKRHLWFSFDADKGLRVEPMLGCRVLLDGGQAVTRRQPVYLAHGARLTVGECVLRLRMFAGFEYAGRQNARAIGAPRPQEPHETAPAAPQVPAVPSAELAALQRQQLLMQQQMILQQQAMAMQQQALLQRQAAAAQARRPAVVTDAAYRPPVDENEYDEEYEDEYGDAAWGADGDEDDEYETGDEENEACGEAGEAGQDEAGEYAASRGRIAPRAGQPAYPARGAAMPYAGQPAPRAHGRESWLPPLEEDAAPSHGPLGDTQEWPALPYPQRDDVHFENSGYTYPEYVEPDKSLYVEPSDSDRADALVWDKLLKRRRDE